MSAEHVPPDLEALEALGKIRVRVFGALSFFCK